MISKRNKNKLTSRFYRKHKINKINSNLSINCSNIRNCSDYTYVYQSFSRIQKLLEPEVKSQIVRVRGKENSSENVLEILKEIDKKQANFHKFLQFRDKMQGFPSQIVKFNKG